MYRDFPQPTPEEKRFHDSGRRIEAITLYRERTSMGLAEAFCALKGITAEQHLANCIAPAYLDEAVRNLRTGAAR